MLCVIGVMYFSFAYDMTTQKLATTFAFATTFLKISYLLEQELANFFFKESDVNTLGFAGHVVFVTAS